MTGLEVRHETTSDPGSRPSRCGVAIVIVRVAPSCAGLPAPFVAGCAVLVVVPQIGMALLGEVRRRVSSVAE
jgi:hypothetical protein